MRVIVRLVALSGLLTLFAWMSGPGAAMASAVPSQRVPTQMRHLVRIGTVNLRDLAAHARSAPSSAQSRHLQKPNGAGRKAAAAAAGVPVPNPGPTDLVNSSGGSKGFSGITVLSQAQANGSSRITLEPPDQGICAHSGVLIEAVNLALQVYKESGQALTSQVSLNSFFHLPPVVDFSHNPPTFGPFLSDPRCYYDAQTKRWFLTSLEIDINPYTGAFGYRSAEMLAVSQSQDPTAGWGLFMFDTTNDGTDGTPKEPNCPCFGDQPRIGADANGFYIATDSYPIHGLFNSNGGEIYAMSKTGLAAAANGGPTPTLVAIHNGAVIVDGYPANAVQPATSPEGGSYAPDTEYFLNTPDYNGFATSGGHGEDSVEIWALHGTSTLNSPNPTVVLTWDEIKSENYAPPVPAQQKPGPTPYGTSIGAKEAQITVNDDRMEQVQYVNGLLYSSLNTGVGANNKADRSGIAWFVVQPNGNSGTVVHQGYVAAGGGTSLMYPSIGQSPAGKGVLTFSVSGPSRYPSAAFMEFESSAPDGSINVNAQGAAPEDGFTCYPQSGFGPTCRWGDYTAAFYDGSGNIVFADEYIPNSARAYDSNWGTWVSVLSTGGQ